MNRWFSVLFMSYEFEQVIYQKIKEYCENWNKKNTIKFKIDDFSCKAEFPYSTLSDVKEIISDAIIKGWEVGVIMKHIYNIEDYKCADYIKMQGAGLNDKFYKEELNLSNESYHCSKCKEKNGYLIGYRKFEKPFIMDESFTRKPQNGEKQKPKLQWDIFDISESGLFISKRMADFFEKHNVTGYVLHDVINEKTNKISENYFMLGSDTLIVTDCNEHTLRREATGSCQACGSEIQSDLLSELHFRDIDVKGKDIFIHGLLYTNGSTYFSQRLYKLLL